MISAVKQICFDVFVHLPFMYFPAFYTVKEFCQGSSYNPVDWVKVLDSQPSGDSHRCFEDGPCLIDPRLHFMRPLLTAQAPSLSMP